MTRFAPALAFALAFAGLFFTRPHATPGPVLRDFEAYYAAGAVWKRGGDAYSMQIWSAEKSVPGVDARRLEVLPYVGVPQALPVFGALAAMPYRRASVAWAGLVVASCGLLLCFASALARRRRLTLASFAWLALFAVGFGPLTSDVALGQIAAPAAAALAGSALALSHRRWTLAGFGTLVAALQPNLALALLSQLTRRRAAIVVGAAVAVFFVTFALVQPPGARHGLLAYLDLLRAHGAAERFTLIQITPASIAYAVAGPRVATIVAVLVGVAAVAVWLGGMRSVRADGAISLAFTCALLPFALPFFHEHDAVLLVIPALVAGTRCSSRLWPLAFAGTLLAAVDWLGIAQRPDGWLQTLLLMGCAAIAYTLACERTLHFAWIAAATGAAVVAAAAFAAGHPAPIWPDAMGPHPALGALRSVTSAWSAQLHAAGQDAAVPFFAALRSCTLLGSGLLAYVSWRCSADSKRSSLRREPAR